jgi:hypothetical protein
VRGRRRVRPRGVRRGTGFGSGYVLRNGACSTLGAARRARGCRPGSSARDRRSSTALSPVSADGSTATPRRPKPSLCPTPRRRCGSSRDVEPPNERFRRRARLRARR